MKVWKPKSSYAATRDGDWDPFMDRVNACLSTEEVWAFWNEYLVHEHRNWPEVWSLALREACEAKAEELAALDPAREMDEAYRLTVGAPVSLTSSRRAVP